jgi:hypothetical protein
MVLPLRIPHLNLLVCANRLRKAIYIFLFLFLPIQNWGQELSFDEAINCLRNKDIVERTMLKKGLLLIDREQNTVFYSFPITVNDQLKEKLDYLDFIGNGTRTYYTTTKQRDFSSFIKERKMVILNNGRDTISAEFLQCLISTYTEYASNFNPIDKTATEWYHFKKEECVTLFGQSDFCIFGMNTTLKIEIFEEQKFNDWSNIIDSKCKFIRIDTHNNESSYHYEFQDILLELTNSTEENRYSIEFTLPTPR